MFEESLAGRERMIVYTKKDLGSTGGAEEQKVYVNGGRRLCTLADTVCRGMKAFVNGTPPARSSSLTIENGRMSAGYWT